MRTVDWDSANNEVKLIDQRQLPGRLVVNAYRDYCALAQAIHEMVVRGAPAIGVTAAYGIALAACRAKTSERGALVAELEQAADVLRASRPTAVNLFWAIDRIMQVAHTFNGTAAELRVRLVQAAQRMADEDVQINRHMAEIGAGLIEDGDTIIHHCNTGALAAVDWGTALGCIRMAHTMGKKVHVLVDETRPRLQGMRLTAWELQQYGISFEIITDNAAGFFLRRGEVQKVMFGSDRVASNGDVVNKIGTYMLALAAHSNGVPVYAVMPSSTVDLSIPEGDVIPIEERDPQEVLSLEVMGESIAPKGAQARNPAFDVTPHALITALVTEKGVIYPPYHLNLPRILGQQ